MKTKLTTVGLITGSELLVSMTPTAFAVEGGPWAAHFWRGHHALRGRGATDYQNGILSAI